MNSIGRIPHSRMPSSRTHSNPAGQTGCLPEFLSTFNWPLATASVVLTMKGTSVGSAKVVLGHVGPKPVVAADAAAFLAGKTITEEVAEQAGAAAVKGATPLSKNEYKVQLAKVAVKRAILQAAGKLA